MSLPIFLGAVTAGLSLYEMWKASKPVPLGNMRLLQDPNEEEVNDVGVVQGNPGGGGGGGGMGPGGGSSLGPVQGIQPGGGGMGPGSGGQWVPTTPMPTSAEINRGNGDGWGNNWGVSGWGWGWPYYSYGYGYPYGYGYGYPYGYGLPQQPQGMVCEQSEDDPKKFVCEPQYPQYQRARAYTWAPPFWGW